MNFTRWQNTDAMKELQECTSKVAMRFDAMATTIENLQKEIEHLKSEHYKDDELKSMKAKLEEARADLSRGFGISEEEHKAIREWIDNHEKTAHGDAKFPRGGAIGGSYDYIFTPTSIGVVGEVKCSCGASFTFSEL